ncbi:SOS response-associated peptidase family protein [Bradyrhizobium zhanjiangense]|uniref:SOS response-associated peptidase family protein n=1 Tax=Bradyrhizobium zhanjiangense TaxID=1325107 RepID=UPI001FDF91CD|nr:SOS response-associated peptidase family protein [Bradyrhizobium zhanjiangense]
MRLDARMAPKYHPTPLSGGDRKALAKELGKARAMANILATQSAEMRAKGEAMIQQADRLLCESWNERMWSDGEPIDPSPTIDQAVNGGFPWLEIRCARCKTPSDVDLEHRCIVPFNSFSEFNKAEGGDIWFALDGTRPLSCFAGIWTNWTSVRKVKEGETTNDLFAFLTTEPNAEVSAIHPKAMPVILTTPDEVESWMTAPPDEALKLQRPLPDGTLHVVARGVKEDPGPVS